MPPPRTVTCYICGRDFGSRSIGIHLPSCTKKWEQEQEKLPKKERRPIPSAPPDFDKVVKGELKGKALAKVNQQAADEFNEAALEACTFCGRTFMPTALAHHRNACTEEKPMARKSPGESYTAQAKAKVNYPKLKAKSGANKGAEKDDEAQQKDKGEVVETVKEKPIEIQIIQQEKKVEKPVTPKVARKPPSGAPRLAVADELEEEDRPGSSASSLVMVSRPASQPGSKPGSKPASQAGSPPASNRSSLDLEKEDERETREREEFEALERATVEELRSVEEEEVAPLQANPRKATTTLRRGPGTFRKSPTYVCKDATKAKGVTREHIIAFLEQEGLLEQQEHRKEVLHLLTDYVRQARKKQMEELLASPALADPDILEEAVNLLQDFVTQKTP